MPLAGGTDLLPNMKRRQQVPRTLLSLRGIDGLHQVHSRSILVSGFWRLPYAFRRLRAIRTSAMELLPLAQAAYQQVATRRTFAIWVRWAATFALIRGATTTTRVTSGGSRSIFA